MIPEVRQWFNENFSEEKYQSYLQYLDNLFPGAIEFRIAETPVFVDNAFTQKMLNACESIIDVIRQPSFQEKTNAAIPKEYHVPNQNTHPHFIVFDFGICESKEGRLEPQLVEMQGFPSLFAYQLFQDEAARSAYSIDEKYNTYLNGFNKEKTIQLLREIIITDENPENVVLLELYPDKQKTRVDFYATKKIIGLSIVCVTEVQKEGNKLYYLNNGVKTQIKRIYNRLIFDELASQPIEVQEKAKFLFEDIDVAWVTHPNWFYRISKYTLPFLNHSNIPKTWFLNEVAVLPEDLENYVVKPLFSFAGRGVIIDVTKEQIEEIRDKENYILQQKVKYAEAIKTLDEPAKAEIRVFYFWKDKAAKPVATHNLARLTKGKMIGVGYNKDKTWVGGSLAYFENFIQ